MRWLVALLLGLASACGEKAPPPGTRDASGPAPALDVSPPEDLAAVPRLGSVYKEAYERAKAELNSDNIAEALDEIERAVDQESRELER